MSTDQTTTTISSAQLLALSSLRASSSAKTIHSQTSLAPLGRDSSYFGASVYASPAHSDNDDSDSDDGHSDSTLEDDESLMLFGHPLERMPRTTSADHGFYYEQDLNSLLFASRSSRTSSRTDSVISTSGASYDAIDYDQIIDYLRNLKPDPFQLSDHRHLIFPDPGQYPFIISSPPLMFKRLQRSSSELRLLLELNRPGIRDDPWNAAPHFLAAVERADDVYLCLKRLSEYNQPPLVTVAHYIDLFRQILEGLSSLHERCIAGLSCAEPSSYMVDLSSASRTSAIFSHDAGPGNIGPQQFDRVSYPVKYYLVNYTKASYIHKKSISSSSTPGSPAQELESLDTCPFRKDVQDSATMIDGLLSDVPQIFLKFKPLIKAMTIGGFTADNSRRLFEALCRALEAPIFESAAQPVSTLECAHTAPHTIPSLLENNHFRPVEKLRSY